VSEYFSHAVHGDDCAALIQASPDISERTKRVAREHKMLMRMGSVLRAGKTMVTPALTSIREGRPDLKDRIAERRLAVGLAQLSHRATDGYFKPVYRALAPEYYDNDYAASPSDIRILQDIALYHARKDLKLAEGDPLYDPLLFRHLAPISAEQSPDVARLLETLYGARVMQELIGLHELFSAGATTNRKLRAYIMALDPIYIDTARYADLAAQPHFNLVQRYIVEPRFYDPDDPYVSLAVDIQNGGDPDPERLAAAKAADEEALCQWGVALRLGVRYFEAAEAYMGGKIDRAAFEAEALS